VPLRASDDAYSDVYYEAPVRVVVFSWRDIQNPRAGGAERLTYEHLRRWAAAGHNVTLLTARYAGVSDEQEIEGIRIVRRGGPYTVHIAAQHWYRRRRPRPDVVVDEIHGLPFLALAYAGVPVVALIHEVARDIWFSMYPPPVAVGGYAAEAAALRWYARNKVPFLVNSPSTAADLSAIGVARANMVIAEPAIDRPWLEQLPTKETTPTLVYLGRLVRMKGVEDVIHALAQVRRTLPECRLWILGAGAPLYEAALRGVAAELDVGAAIQFMGRVDEEEKFRLLGRAHLLLHASRHEGWGINIMEANAMGTPAVAYNVPGLRDSVRGGQTGVLCRYGRVDELAASAISLLQRTEDYQAMQRNAITWSTRFSWDVAAERSLGLLTSLAQSARLTGPTAPAYTRPENATVGCDPYGRPGQERE